MRRRVREQIQFNWRYRHLLWALVQRDLKVRYRRSILGFGWALLNPILMTTIFSVVFSFFLRPPATSVPFPLFFLTGVLAWNLCSTSIITSLRSITDNSSIVTKIYFPRSLLPISAVLASTVHFMLGILVIVPITIFVGVRPSPSILLLPVILLSQVLFLSGLGLALSVINVFFRDTQATIDVLLQAWFFATPVVYDLRSITGSPGVTLADVVDLVNPMAPVISQYRQVLLNAAAPDPMYLLRTFFIAAAIFAVGLVFFARWAGRVGDEL